MEFVIFPVFFFVAYKQNNDFFIDLFDKFKYIYTTLLEICKIVLSDTKFLNNSVLDKRNAVNTQ